MTQERLTRLIEDLTYLQDEAEALQYVIDSVPYEDSPPDSYSILDNLLFLDYLQVNYFRPLFESVKGSSHNVQVSSKPTHDSVNSISDHDEKPDIQRVLAKISKHRAALINIIRQIPLTHWDKYIYNGEEEQTLYEFSKDLIFADRKILKEIADLIMAFQKDHMAMRQIRVQPKGNHG